MRFKISLPLWTIVSPAFAMLTLLGIVMGLQGLFLIVAAAALIAGVLAGVHHAEVVAHRVGEPFGTLVLALAITVIEVALIVSLMLAGGEKTAELARDTVFAAVMIILNGIVGICLLVGGLRYKEQVFRLGGASAALITLTAICFLTLILPNYTVSEAGGAYSKSQLIFELQWLYDPLQKCSRILFVRHDIPVFKQTDHFAVFLVQQVLGRDQGCSEGWVISSSHM
ncbi:MAG: hypothetical protein EOP49_30590, partial [Sphingobacteriales bacterium]